MCLTGNDDLPHGYCILSRVLKMFVQGDLTQDGIRGFIALKPRKKDINPQRRGLSNTGLFFKGICANFCIIIIITY